MLSFIISACILLTSQASAACDRDLLKDATEQYVLAQSTGSTSALTLLADNLTYTENEKPMNIAAGVLTQPVIIDSSRSIHDPTLCATFTELIAATNEHPYVIGTRMILTDEKITKIESIVTDKGDWLFDAAGYLHWNSLEKWDVIPEEQRDSREVIQAAGDAYFNRFMNANVSVPFGTPCTRLEGGAYTDMNSTGTNTCSLGLPSTIVVQNRRYVIDEEMGVVDMYLDFPELDRSVSDQAMPDSHMFRVEKGQIRYIHTVSSCVNDGCGLNGTFVPIDFRRRALLSRSARRSSTRLY
ncbi:hypothetical protein F4778DRAFT_755823 [Xylariomycetidae sp. FL2044]|nr:hypothetical protein F4778DRAFT_755823 [Xylariomycetidae sp. FL2044]